MKEMVQIGDTFTYVLRTAEEMSASRFQQSSPPMFATPFLVGAVEAAAGLMERWMDEGEMSVGAGFDLKHTAPTPLGWEVRTVARLAEAKGRKFVFEMECFDEAEKIGGARHTRFVIDGRAFLEQVARKAARRKGGS
jgi:fluoroacetyl-CoA thioesterase